MMFFFFLFFSRMSGGARAERTYDRRGVEECRESVFGVFGVFGVFLRCFQKGDGMSEAVK